MSQAVCGAAGKLLDESVIMIFNMAHASSIHDWEVQNLRCEIPSGHEHEHHICQVTEQFANGLIYWWASWTDRFPESAAFFSAPVCTETDGCRFLASHVNSYPCVPLNF